MPGAVMPLSWLQSRFVPVTGITIASATIKLCASQRVADPSECRTTVAVRALRRRVTTARQTPGVDHSGNIRFRYVEPTRGARQYLARVALDFRGDFPYRRRYSPPNSTTKPAETLASLGAGISSLHIGPHSGAFRSPHTAPSIWGSLRWPPSL